MNNLEENNRSWKKNWKWVIPVVGIFLISMFMISTTDIGENTFDVIKAYADPDLVENALKKAQENEEVKEILGRLEQVDKLAKLEGLVKYSNDDTSVEINIRVKGSKGKGRMRILAERNGETWEYKKIDIGIKKIKKTIEIIGSTN